MKRHHHHRQVQPVAVPAPKRRVGIPTLTIAAVAAACVLAACGPEEVTASAVIPAPELAATTTSIAPQRLSEPATAQVQRAVLSMPIAPATPNSALAAPGTTDADAPRMIRVADRGAYRGELYAQNDNGYYRDGQYYRNEPGYRDGYRNDRYAQGDRNAQRPQYGQVTSIEPITEPTKSGPGAGTVIGGVLGAVVGNQVGSGGGRAAATVLGGVGGAVVGNKIEKKRSEQVVGYRIHVQLDNGTTRSFDRNQLGSIDVGDRVRVDGANLREV